MNRIQQSKQAAQLVESVRTVREAFTRAKLDGIEVLGMQVMLVLYIDEGLSLKACADRLSVGPTNVSKAVRALTESSMLQRRTVDHRTASLVLTPAGRTRVERFLSA